MTALISEYHGLHGQSDVPLAYADPLDSAAIGDDELQALVAPFWKNSVGEMYLGPGWVNGAGVACLVLMAYDERWPRRVRKEGRCALLAWRWPDTPSVPFSLTLMLTRGTPRPHVRWIRASDDPVVQAIRQEGCFLLTVANAKGESSGWFKAVFREGLGLNSRPSRRALEHLWTFPATGIPYSNIHERFDPLRRDHYDSSDEIPLWPEPISDYWSVLDCDGPWTADLTQRDRAMAAWGRQAWRDRHFAVGLIRVLWEKQHLDGEPPYFDSDGRLLREGPLRNRTQRLISSYPLIGQWLTALAGPLVDARQAHEAALSVLYHPPSLFASLDQLFQILIELDDDDISLAVTRCIHAALIDHRITARGTCRPWLGNTGAYGLELRTMPVDLTAPLEDIRLLWRTQTELNTLIDTGRMLSPSDLPVPRDKMDNALENVVVDGSRETAEVRVHDLLVEAQQARQWSIPWGARVEVYFPPFIAVRIYEINGEFSCYFLDDQDRYFLVAIGLSRPTPQISTEYLVRSQDDRAGIWNDDAEISLKLIAAAIVRDFLVVEDRESVFCSRHVRRRVRGHNVRTIIYLPRVRYSAPRAANVPLNSVTPVRARHHVAQHLRRAKTAAPAQRFLAQRYGMLLPEGFTFVRPHERGTTNEARIRIYRSRSASQMIFEAMDKTPVGTRPAWFDFEKDCARLLAGQGMRVIHQAAQRDGDGGVDLYAVDKDGQSWVVQCKCWAPHRLVGPETVRELEGAIRLADKGSAAISRGMIITTSGFTSGASTTAAEFRFVLIDGEELVRMVVTLPQRSL